MFPAKISSDSTIGVNTFDIYSSKVDESYQQLEVICGDNKWLFQSLHESLLKKWMLLDDLANQFVENSAKTMLFTSDRDIQELVQIVVLDVKKVVLDNLIQLVEKKTKEFHPKVKNKSKSFTDRDLSDYTPTSNSKKKRPNLPSYAKDILSNWFREHVDHPYPTQSEKVELSEQAGLSVQKVDNWFINERSRKWQTYKQK